MKPIRLRKLRELGVPEETAKEIMKVQNEKGPRDYIWLTDPIPEITAARINQQFPEANLHRKLWTKKES